MTKNLMIGAAISALMISGAFAQSSMDKSNMDKSGANTTPPAAAQTAPTKGATSAATTGTATFISSQQSNQWLSSKFEGTDVLGSDDKKIGDVSDILFDQSGKIEAYVVSVGGFLGMGAKEVAMAPSAFTVVPGDNGGAPKLKTSMTQDQLKSAQAFARAETKPTTTGAGSKHRHEAAATRA